jgi:alanine racemase
MTRLVVDLSALRRNYQAICQETGVPVIPMLKADCYGLGAEKVFTVLQAEGAARFAVSRIEEGLPLCNRGAEILLLSAYHCEEDLRRIVESGMTAAVDSLAQAKLLDKLAAESDRIVSVHLKVDTGFGRFGFLPEEYPDLTAVFGLEHLQVQGIFSHFSNAFGAESDTEAQYKAFIALCDRLVADGFDPGLRHIANSCGALRWDKYRLDAVRVGSALLGRLPVKVRIPLERIGALESTIAALRQLKKGSNMGYGNAFTLKKDTRVAVICAGSAHGMLVKKENDAFRPKDVLRYLRRDFRLLVKDGRSRVLVNGQSTWVVGRVALTHTMVDVTNIACKPGDTVILPANPIYVPQSVERFYTE